MSVSLTEDAVRLRRKTVTRRLGWTFLEPGTPLDLCRKVMGRRKGEPLVRVAHVRVLAVSRERLDAITDADVHREGFAAQDLTDYGIPDPYCYAPGALSAAFVRYFCEHMKCSPETLVTRIEWEYLG